MKKYMLTCPNSQNSGGEYNCLENLRALFDSHNDEEDFLWVSFFKKMIEPIFFLKKV